MQSEAEAISGGICSANRAATCRGLDGSGRGTVYGCCLAKEASCEAEVEASSVPISALETP